MYAICVVKLVQCGLVFYAVQKEVDDFIDMARKQVETVWKQYVFSLSLFDWPCISVVMVLVSGLWSFPALNPFYG